MRANISDLWILLVNARIRGFIFDCVLFFPLLYSSSSSSFFFRHGNIPLSRRAREKFNSRFQILFGGVGVVR